MFLAELPEQGKDRWPEAVGLSKEEAISLIKSEDPSAQVKALPEV